MHVHRNSNFFPWANGGISKTKPIKKDLLLIEGRSLFDYQVVADYEHFTLHVITAKNSQKLMLEIIVMLQATLYLADTAYCSTF